jgi:hypothetical protein
MNLNLHISTIKETAPMLRIYEEENFENIFEEVRRK